MSKISNDNNNVLIELSPILSDDFGILCNLKVESELLNLDYKNVSENDRYMTHENIRYFKKEIKNLNNLAKFNEDDLILAIYPIDMFFTMDVFKIDDAFLSVSLRLPVGVYTNSKVAGYNIGLDFHVSLESLASFCRHFLSEGPPLSAQESF